MDSAYRQHTPVLARVSTGGVTVWTDLAMRNRVGVTVAFTERTGGVSGEPYDSLNLAAHVGDDPILVDENRDRLLSALGLGQIAENLVLAEQVHGDRTHVVTDRDAGCGSRASGDRDPILETDALLTARIGTPLLMCFADCVPVILVAEGSAGPGVAVVHAGWRGALAGLPGKAASLLMEHVGATPTDTRAYIGPHIGPCCYDVDAERSSLFANRFDTIAAVGYGLDLSAAVNESLLEVGICREMTAEAGQCTSDHTERFYSFRVSPVTGRHGAIAAIV